MTGRAGRRKAARPALRALAERLGIIAQYIDQTGRHVRHTSDDTREALLAVMGFDAPTEDAARGWLAELDHEAATSIVEPVRVVERDAASARVVAVQVPPGIRAASVQVVVTEEHGREMRVSARIRRSGRIRLPSPLPYGYHRLAVELTSEGRETTAEQSLIVVPSSCIAPESILGTDKVFGIVANLYAARREEDWGIGDFTTLTQLVDWAGGKGADFVGVNPLHALFNRGAHVSPYSPVSRLFRNHIYIDVAEALNGRRVDDANASRAAALRRQTHVDYDGVIQLKEEALREAHRIFRAAGGHRLREFEGFVRAREPELSRYATWMAIAEAAGSTDWRQWPATMHDPESSSVAAFREANAERVDFHRWAQFETWRQLGETAARAKAVGMRIGVYQDLAIGTNPGGSDTWSYPDLFLQGAAVGAPPDPYSSTGQNWGLPPMDPRALRQQCYRYWIQLLRRAFEHAGALRIDHVMGLFRTFWIPDGGTGKDGAYVRHPSKDLLGILALESVRNDALVVGEDLGTVPPDVPPAMKKWKVLSSKVLYFEKDRRGRFRPASRYPELALATANTHDMAPIAGFWEGRDVELRRAFGLVPGAAHRRALAERKVERESLLERAPVAPQSASEFAARLTSGVHAFLCGTRSRLVGISWDDVLGEREPVNVPGVGPDRYPSWRRRNRTTVEEAALSPAVDAALGCESRRRGR